MQSVDLRTCAHVQKKKEKRKKGKKKSSTVITRHDLIINPFNLCERLVRVVVNRGGLEDYAISIRRRIVFF